MAAKKPDSATKTPRGALSDTNSKIQYLYIVIFLVNFVVSLSYATMTYGNSFSMTMFGGGLFSDQFMDFLNSVRDSAQTNAYYSRYSIYPPLAVLVFRFFASLLDQDVVATEFASRTTLYADQRTMLLYLFFVVICIILMDKMMDYRMRDAKNKITARICTFMMVFSYPVVYCVERGNITLLCVLTSMFFFFFRDSESKVVRELAYISLALSAGIKFYPAIFGLILIIEKKYKEAARLVAYGIIAIIVPWLWVNRLDNLTNAALAQQIFEETGEYIEPAVIDMGTSFKGIWSNLTHFFGVKSGGLSFSSVSIQHLFYLPDIKNLLGSAVDNVALGFTIATEVIAFALLCTIKREWQRVYLMTYLLLNIPAASSTYAVAFLIIPFTLFLVEEHKRSKIEWVTLVLFSLQLSFIPVFWCLNSGYARMWMSRNGFGSGTDIAPNKIFGGIMFQIMFLTVIIPEIIRIFRYLKARKKAKAEQTAKPAEAPAA